MHEDKWGVLERFRVRPQWRGRVLREDPGLLARAVTARTGLMQGGAHLLGPFLLRFEGEDWWTLLWQFPRREDARALRALCEDAAWNRYVETRLVEGWKHDPVDGLPGF